MNDTEINLYYGNNENEIKQILDVLENNNIPYRFEEDKDNPVSSSDENPNISIFINSYNMEKAENLLNKNFNDGATNFDPIDDVSSIPEELIEDEYETNPKDLEEEKENIKIFYLAASIFIAILIFALILLYILLK